MKKKSYLQGVYPHPLYFEKWFKIMKNREIHFE